MIHFFPAFSKDARNSPFAKELANLGVPHALFSDEVILRYRSRIWLLVVGWPKVIKFAFKSAIRSLLLSTPYPDTVVVNSHIEALVFGLIRTLRLRKGPEIVLLGFIYTRRRNVIANLLRTQYFRFVFSIIDIAIVHSVLEAKRYQKLFPNARTRFLFVPYGLHIHGREQSGESLVPPDARPYILTAGRSGRDYATLFEAVTNLPIDLHVVCDSQSTLAGLTIPPNVLLLRNCYDRAYVEQIRNARFVVIPLDVDNISAGQMVLIQAMAFSKPTVITRTATVEEYTTDGEQSLLVPAHDPKRMREAIWRLLDDPKLAELLARNAVITYEKKFCMQAFVRQLVETLRANSSYEKTRDFP